VLFSLRIEVKAPALGETAAQLPGLIPGADALVALARLPAASAWEQARLDPGAVLLIARHCPAPNANPGITFFPAVLQDGAILKDALCLLDRPGIGRLDWSQPPIQPLYQACLTGARLAHELAQQSQCCDPDRAWIAGMLVPLGWIAVAAIDPNHMLAGLGNSASENPSTSQRRAWGIDHAAIARRLSRRWGLPDWLAGVIGHVELPIDLAQWLGADIDLFRITQLAVGLTQRQGRGLPMVVGTAPSQNAASLAMSPEALEEIERRIVAGEGSSVPPTWQFPEAIPLLRDMLAIAAENRRLAKSTEWSSLEEEVDRLHEALCEQKTTEADRLRALKLEALAELAGGAGHEINNPLAVISGQAQYLLAHDSDPDRQKSLQSIISQTQRIHQILSDLMQFARPSRPQFQALDLPAAIHEVAASLDELATRRRVRLLLPPLEPTIQAYADPRQLHTALACLLRNAIEAAPTEGWAEVRLATPTNHHLEIVVEDNGQGLAPVQREHLFDPFFSGRTAGRGRGLGLPTAWRLARQQGGDVRLEEVPSGPTRFVMTLPRETGSNGTGTNH
jgi:signal transduction histidine kinase